MSYIALQLPNFDPNGGETVTVPVTPGLESRFPSESFTIGFFVTQAFQVVFYLAAFLAFFWFVWGAFEYILAEGKKDNIAKAISRMQWAIVGFIVLIAMFFVGQFTRNIFPQVDQFYNNKTINENIEGNNPTTVLQRANELRRGERSGN